ncbi:recombinase family protein [Streptosporangium canum]|uniref:recombinase family protein n=1 Tax=Streptosporangium canum TaxID=324952 RepID=UPI0033ABE1EE
MSAIMGRAELHSPEIQIDACEQLAQRTNIEIIDVVQDLDRSGRDFAKRQINKMIEEVRRGDYEVIIIWKWSRFGRNLRDSLNNIHRLEGVGGEAMCATEPGDGKTTMGKFNRANMLNIAELQSNMIGDSWKDTFAVRQRMGLPHNGVPGFGYIKDGRDSQPDPILGPAVAEVYQRWVADEPLRTIGKDMADRGIRAANGDILTNSRWHKVMDSGFAAGLVRTRKPGATSRRFDQWDWHQGAHKALISMEIWEAYKRKRLGTLGKNRTSTKAKYSLSGMIRCSRCMTRKCVATASPHKKSDTLFRCAGVLTKECRGVFGLLRLGEAEVLKWLEQKAQNLETVNDEARIAAAKQNESGELQRLEKLVNDIKRKLERLLDIYEDGQLSKEKYVERRSQREAELREAEQALRDHRGNDRPEIPATFFKSLADAWPSLSQDKRRQALKQVIREIVLHPVGHPGGRWEIVPFREV